mgnify:CR=1 FL=1
MVEVDGGAPTVLMNQLRDAKAEAEQLLGLMLKYASGPDGSFGFLLHELSLLVAAPLCAAASVSSYSSRKLNRRSMRCKSENESAHSANIEASPAAFCGLDSRN